MNKILTALLESFRLLNPVVSLTGGALTMALGLFNFFNAMWAEMLTRLASVTLSPAVAASVMSGFDFVNYVFPLSELFTFCSGYMTLYVVCAGVRMVKAFIPTIS